MTVNKNIEKRIFTVNLKKDTENRSVTGHAAVVNSLSNDFGGWKEIIMPGAFRSALNKTDLDVRALLNHDENHLLGRHIANRNDGKTNTLSLKEADTGLVYDFSMPKHRDDIIELIERGDLTQNSFAFRVRTAHWEKRDGFDLRVIDEIESLHDISLVTYPAYPDTDVALRSYKEMKEKEKPVDKTDYSLLESIITLHQHSF